MKIELYLPPRELSPNARVHHMKLHRIKKKYRLDAITLTGLRCIELGVDPPNWKRASVQYHFYFTKRRRRDPDNFIASMKAALDGIVNAGIIEDDSNIIMRTPIIDIDKTRPRVEIHVEKIT